MIRALNSGLLRLFASLLIACSATASASQLETQFVEGKDFYRVSKKVIDQANELDALKKVADIEIFYWYGCAACLRVELALTDYLADKPVLFVRRTPLVAHLDWRPQAYLQPLMEALAGQIKTPDSVTLYETCLADCTVFNSYEAIKSWLKSRQNGAELPFFNESEIWRAEKNYRKRADSYSIRQVPTIIIKERYKVDANSAQSVERMVQIIDYLLTQTP